MFWVMIHDILASTAMAFRRYLDIWVESLVHNDLGMAWYIRGEWHGYMEDGDGLFVDDGWVALGAYP